MSTTGLHADVGGWRRAAMATLMLLTLTSCSSDSGASEGQHPSDSRAQPSRSETASPETEAAAACPNSDGGQCRGNLAAGKYHTEVFEPQLAYTVPAGWANMEDLPGNMLLLPPGRDLGGLDAGAIDYLGVYSGAAVAAADCESAAMPGVGFRPKTIATALQQRPGLDTSTPHKVAVGGLHGLVMDIRLAPGTKAGCTVEGGLTIIPLFIGAGPASVEHAQVPGLRTRLYVLANGKSNIILEASDVAKDADTFEFEPVLSSFDFAAG